MQDALQMLGFGPCHHMEDILNDPSQVGHWHDIQAGKAVDWSAVFAG